VTTIVLIRHAATAWSGRRYSGRSDPPLSTAGRRAAETLAARLAVTLPAGVRIIASPSRRARETATILATAAAPAVLEIDARWMEADFGVADGLTFEDIEARSPALAARLAAGDVDIDWPGGETAVALHDRVAAAWTAILATGRPTVVVSHAGPIRIAVALASGRAPAEVGLPAPAEAVTFEVGDVAQAARASPIGP
jgi:broad specificity phosphatase PhoE